VVFGSMVALFGVEVLPFVLAQAVIGFFLLEAVNYIEHYGLLRRTLHGGTSRYGTFPKHRSCRRATPA
jgi:alkane 1-monooxygenase